MRVIGFDISQSRIDELLAGHDRTREVSPSELAGAEFLTFTSDINDIASCNVYIVTVPTPIDRYRSPDLSFLLKASQIIGTVLENGDVVIYESTVYPGCTEEECIPVLEYFSDLKLNTDFFCGYSPERVNPGDKEHRIADIVKVTSGSTPEAADFIDNLYRVIITAGTHKAESIKVAEAAKIIENTQRDINIALINELAIIFNKLNIDTAAVLNAAETKWNFLPFKPGLVGGHCIGVDPYYLKHKAEAMGIHPQLISVSRQINDGMGVYLANRLIKKMIKNSISVKDAKVLVMGLAFKENCPDTRNSKVIDVIHELKSYGVLVEVYDPWVEVEDAKNEYSIEPIQDLPNNRYDAIILAVGHQIFQELGVGRIRRLGKKKHLLFDVKQLFDVSLTDISF
jgi:UDP-N-acetyl-D-galactosamine dehydrogenase